MHADVLGGGKENGAAWFFHGRMEQRWAHGCGRRWLVGGESICAESAVVCAVIREGGGCRKAESTRVGTRPRESECMGLGFVYSMRALAVQVVFPQFAPNTGQRKSKTGGTRRRPSERARVLRLATCERMQRKSSSSGVRYLLSSSGRRSDR